MSADVGGSARGSVAASRQVLALGRDFSGARRHFLLTLHCHPGFAAQAIAGTTLAGTVNTQNRFRARVTLIESASKRDPSVPFTIPYDPRLRGWLGRKIAAKT